MKENYEKIDKLIDRIKDRFEQSSVKLKFTKLNYNDLYKINNRDFSKINNNNNIKFDKELDESLNKIKEE